MPMGTWPSPTTPLDALSFTFVDVETTGLDPTTGHRVCEIALLRVHGDHEVARFESLVHPQRPMHPGSLAVHGITDDMLVGGPTFAASLRRGAKVCVHRSISSVMPCTARAPGCMGRWGCTRDSKRATS